MRRRLLLPLLALALGWATAASALTCNVPSANYPTISSAIREPTCSPIVVAAGTYPENLLLPRLLTLQGAGPALTVVAGSVRARGASTIAVLSGFQVDGTASGVSGCWASLVDAEEGARIEAGPSVEVVASQSPSPCRIFEDGFESGTVLAWSDSVP